MLTKGNPRKLGVHALAQAGMFAKCSGKLACSESDPVADL